tara:strand:- start:774 stop:1403 length:630 start_codon:yes stop_codon:yes gene_type:complete
MRYIAIIILGTLITGCITKSSQLNNSVILFDGKSFNGWEGNMKFFRIEDGCIVGGRLNEKIPNNEFLCTTNEYDNFELKLKFKIVGSSDANAGVQFRTKRIPNHHEVIGFQADIGQKYWGALYDESRRNKVLAGPQIEDIPRIANFNGWNEYRIIARDNHIQLYLNGHKTVDYIEKDPRIEEKGLIALQVHGGPAFEIWYKDISIIDIP